MAAVRRIGLAVVLVAVVAAAAPAVAAAAPPLNDNRAQALPLTTGVTFRGNNIDATHESTELLSCVTGGITSFDATVWFVWRAPDVGVVTIDTTAAYTDVANTGDTVLTVYRGADVTPLACNNDASLPRGPSRLVLSVTPGDYLIQVGAPNNAGLIGHGAITATANFVPNLDLDGDGSLRPADCNDANAAINPGAVDIPEDGIDQNCDGVDAPNLDRDRDGFPRPTDCDDNNAAINPGAIDVPDDGIDQNCDGVDAVNLDRDRDGFPRPADCNDNNASIHPGAVDKPGNKVDENCDGRDAPFPPLNSPVDASWSNSSSFTEFTKIVVRRAKSGSTVRVSCIGDACKLKTKTEKVTRSRSAIDVSKLVRGARFRPGTQLEIRVTKAGTVGVVTRFKVRADGKDPVRTNLCLAPGAKRPGRCTF